MSIVRRRAGTVLVASLLLAGPVARAGSAAYEGPPHDDVDTDPATVVTVFATVPGPVERVTVRVQTSAKYSDNLEIQLVHAGVAVTLYDGNGGDTSDAELNAGFADDVGGTYTTPGSVLGSVAPSPGSLASFIGREASGPWQLRIRNKYGSADDGTDLIFWSVGIRSGLAGPPVAVAVYDDPAFVDNFDADDPGLAAAESLNVQASLASLGHAVSRFEGTSAGAFQAGLAGKQVVVIPELELGDLGAALDEAAEGAIAAFVAGGGTLVKQGGGVADASFLDEVFGYSLTRGGSEASYPLGSPAIGTRFQQGPGRIENPDGTSGLGGLPVGARTIYEDEDSGRSMVTWIPFGSGTVIHLGWDWYDAAPRGTQDGGWLDVLNRAVLGEARAISTRTVALYYDSDYVDLDDNGDPGEAEAEGLTLEAGLASLGHLPARFAGTGLIQFLEAFDAAPVVLIPELEIGDLAAALPGEVKQALAGYVAGGGVLIVHGDSDEHLTPLLSSVFGFSTILGPYLDEGQLAIEPSATSATRFEGAVTNLYGNDATLAIAGLPASALRIYESPADDVGVALIPYGSGKVIYLGWDWYDAAPLGNQDEGWRFVLDRAVLEALPAPEPGAAPLALMAVAALGALARRGAPSSPRIR